MISVYQRSTNNREKLLANSTMASVSGETYFFRDHGQIDLLRLRLLPELIARRGAAKELRLWSAGCSSGEEAYTLAMLVDMMLPEREGWNILILGSDIDQNALAKARRGYYGKWSFRMVPPALQQRYFRQIRDNWVLDERIRGMVTFHASDLLGETSSGQKWQDMDLILCRNVLIYYNVEAVAAIATKLGDALSAGGYLLTGHTELIGQRIKNLQSRLFPDGVVYQQVAPIASERPSTAQIALPPATGKHMSSVPVNPLKQSTNHSPPTPVSSPDELLAMAVKLADRGEYDLAEQSCQQMLALAPLAARPYFLLAQLAQLKGDADRASELLYKTLYLDPGYIAAYLELAGLFERAENLPRAQSLRRAALDVVTALPGNTIVEPYETSAAELAQWLAQ